GAFPTEFHSNWQWWDLVTKSQAMILNDLPPELRPVVSLVDDWFTNRRLGLVVEARVGRGRLLVCSIDLSRALDSRPVARQFRHSLVKYLAGDAFQPSVAVDSAAIQGLFQPATTLQKLGATIRASSAQPDYPAEHAIDGDPNTIWHSPWGDNAPGFPHELVLDLQAVTSLAGLRYLPRQDMANGWISQFEVHLSDDGTQWRPAVSQGIWKTDREAKEVSFDAPQRAGFVRLVAASGHEGKPFAAVAELDVVLGPE
ncbi:MAG: discoidin domain-containing protein, partial [Pirellulaceae bacterium]|nr:discoidin domain-containing protein [Pirellulaceae bacterium]